MFVLRHGFHIHVVITLVTKESVVLFDALMRREKFLSNACRIIFQRGTFPVHIYGVVAYETCSIYVAWYTLFEHYYILITTTPVCMLCYTNKKQC